MAKSDVLYVTDAECAARIGISTDELKAILPELERQGFPLKDPVFGKKRYWRAVHAFLDHRYGLGPAVRTFGPPDEKEPWKK